MRAVVLRSLAVIGVGGLILAGVLYVASTVDARPPEVLAIGLTQPVADGTDQALITTSIEVSFSEPVDAASAEAAVTLDPPVAGSVSWGGTTMIFTPAQPLDLDTAYTVVVAAGVRDLAGNEMAEPAAPFTFVTAGRPTLAAVDPADGDDDVPVDAILELVFSTLMDTASVEAALEVEPSIDHELRWSGERLQIRPAEPLEPATEYTVRLGAAATDVSGVAIGRDLAIGFRTVAPGLAVEAVVPADRVDGIATITPIAIVFDRAIDPDSVAGDLLEITPAVPGSLEPVPPEADEPFAGRLLRFVPTAPLPANTTFEVELLPGVRGEAGRGGMAEPVRWTFTTGAPQATLSNQVLYVSDRSGVANVWAMNADGTGQHQVTAELRPVLDYAAAPNGSAVVVADGRRLVFLAADGSGREVMTEDGFVDFDPAFSPDGSTLAFARADAETGEGLGLWIREVGAGSATRVELPQDVRPGATASPDASPDAPILLRAPRFSPDGSALAYVGPDGAIGILELPAQRHTRIPTAAGEPPVWRPDSSGVLVSLAVAPDDATAIDAATPVEPMEVDSPAGVGLVSRSGTTVQRAGSGDGTRVAAIAGDGRIAYLDAEGSVRIAGRPGEAGETPRGLGRTRLLELTFGPAGQLAVVVLASPSGEPSGLERIDLDSGDRTPLIPDGRQVRWLP